MLEKPVVSDALPHTVSKQLLFSWNPYLMCLDAAVNARRLRKGFTWMNNFAETLLQQFMEDADAQMDNLHDHLQQCPPDSLTPATAVQQLQAWEGALHPAAVQHVAQQFAVLLQEPGDKAATLYALARPHVSMHGCWSLQAGKQALHVETQGPAGSASLAAVDIA